MDDNEFFWEDHPLADRLFFDLASGGDARKTAKGWMDAVDVLRAKALKKR